MFICSITKQMKTPERWCALPRRALFVSILAQKSSKDVKTSHEVMKHAVMSHDVRCHAVTSWRYTTSYDMTKWTCPGQPIWKAENHVFQPRDLDLWPMTMTFKLIQYIVKVNPSTEFCVRTFNRSAGRALTDTQTHTQTHTQTGLIPYPRPLTREGKIKLQWWAHFSLTSICYFGYEAYFSIRSILHIWVILINTSISIGQKEWRNMLHYERTVGSYDRPVCPDSLIRCMYTGM